MSPVARLAALACLGVLGSQASAESDQWFGMTLAGTPAGWSHMVDRVEGDARTTMNETAFRISRAGVEVSMTLQVEWVESRDGTPRSMTSRQDMGVQQMTTLWTFEGDSIRIVTEQDGRRSETVERLRPRRGCSVPCRMHSRAPARGGKDDRLTVSPDFGPNRSP